MNAFSSRRASIRARCASTSASEETVPSRRRSAICFSDQWIGEEFTSEDRAQEVRTQLSRGVLQYAPTVASSCLQHVQVGADLVIGDLRAVTIPFHPLVFEQCVEDVLPQRLFHER